MTEPDPKDKVPGPEDRWGNADPQKKAVIPTPRTGIRTLPGNREGVLEGASGEEPHLQAGEEDVDAALAVALVVRDVDNTYL